MVEKRTGENTTRQGHEGYVVIRTEQELNVQPIEMQPRVEYSLPRRVADKVMQRLPRRDGKR